MKPWGLSKGGAIVAMLLLISGALVLPLGARAQGETLWGVVWTDCGLATERLVLSTDVTLSDAHAQIPDRMFDATSAFFEFQPDPGNYILKVKPDGFTYFTNETLPFRFEGTAPMRKDLCVDAMPAKTLWLNLTVLDAQPVTADETVTFAESSHNNENLTLTYNPSDYTVRVANRPLVNESEAGKLIWFNNTGFTPLTGRPLFRGPDYEYNVGQGFNGFIGILDPQMRIELENSYFGRLSPNPLGWLRIDYRSASTTSNLQHGQVTNETFRRSGVLMDPYTFTLTLDRETGRVTINGNWSFGTDVLRARYDWSGAIGGARIQIRDQVHNQPISANLTTNSAGKASIQVWAATFDVEVDATGYRPIILPTPVASHTDVTVYMTRALEIVVLATDVRGRAVKDGLVAIAINTDLSLDSDVRISRATGAANSNIVRVPAYNGVWDVIVDANGFTAKREVGVLVAGFNRTLVVSLVRSPEERTDTTVLIDDLNWSKITVYRKVTLLSDSEWPGIGFPGLRDRDYQLSMRFGNGDGSFESFEDTNFTASLQAAGTFYTVTPKFITVNGNWYRSNGTSLVVNVTTSGTNMTVWSSVQYTLDSQFKVLAQNQIRYFVNVTTAADRNVTHYQNQTFWVKVPRGYELTDNTTTGRVRTSGFTVVQVDPEIDAVVKNPRADLKIDRSLTGVARAKVEGPAGKVYEKVAKDEGYLAWVANNTAVVFSANATTDRLNQKVNAEFAKFDWTFRYQIENTSVKGTAAGIWTTFDFGSLGTNYSVNLTVTQVNTDNQTWRVINVTVDTLDPVARILTNRTTGENPAALTVKEDLVTTFNGGNSTDLLWGTLKGEIAEWNWDFDSDGTADRTGRVVTFNYSTPGSFIANLTVVDRVGHKSTNQTLNVTVLDTTPPVPDLVIVDENNSWRVVTQLTEKKGYWFNVSRTTDNSLNGTADNVNLTYNYTWGDASNKTGPLTGLTTDLNVSHTYATHGEYKLSINVTDRAGNVGWLNRTLVVQANTTAHPDLSIIAGSLTITPTSPEEGQLATFSFKVENGVGRANATSLRFQLAVLIGGQFSNATVTDLRYLNPDGTVTNRVDTGKNVTVEFKWASPTLGNKTLKLTIWDDDEPKNAIGSANEITTNLLVREAGWKIWAWVGAFLFIIVGLPTIYYVIRKIRAGELHLPRRRKREEGGEEEEDEETEEDEDEEEEGGKKRL